MFQKRVLDPSINEVNSKTDLTIKYEPVLENGKYVKIIFTIGTTDKGILQDEIEGYIVERLTDFGLKRTQIASALKYNDHDYLIGNIKVIEEEIKRKSGKIRNIAAYMIKALQTDYRPTEDH